MRQAGDLKETTFDARDEGRERARLTPNALVWGFTRVQVDDARDRETKVREDGRDAMSGDGQGDGGERRVFIRGGDRDASVDDVGGGDG